MLASSWNKRSGWSIAQEHETQEAVQDTVMEVKAMRGAGGVNEVVAFQIFHDPES